MQTRIKETADTWGESPAPAEGRDVIGVFE
jgi:hypothetical protein